MIEQPGKYVTIIPYSHGKPVDHTSRRRTLEPTCVRIPDCWNLCRAIMKRGFSLLELIVCTLIVSILASLLFPVFKRAIRSAHADQSLSNLRQCFLSVSIYESDHSDLPTYEQAIDALKSAPTRDIDDYWKVSHGAIYEPMINSYAYVRGVKYAFGTGEQWQQYVSDQSEKGRPVPLFASVWQAEPRTEFVSSSEVFPTQPSFFLCWAQRRCFLPSKVTYVFMDGSAKAKQFVQTNPPRPFYWDHLFYKSSDR